MDNDKNNQYGQLRFGKLDWNHLIDIRNREPHPLRVSKKNAENYRQRKISQIAKDLQELTGTDPRITAKVLMARGVPKMFNTKREVVALREAIKRQILAVNTAISDKTIRRPNKKNVPADVKAYYRILGMMEGIDMVKKDLDRILKTKNWQMPTGDEEFAKLLRASAIELISKEK